MTQFHIWKIEKKEMEAKRVRNTRLIVVQGYTANSDRVGKTGFRLLDPKN